ncbi:MAG: L-seryl-tRNA(Sec) selenium transferase [Chitinivibrionales bacterium]|nr:L-seryl-tRNA(Sec) selenium transferase [Chitinivibrionales bacterium]
MLSPTVRLLYFPSMSRNREPSMSEPRRLPAVGRLVNLDACKRLAAEHGRELVTYALREAVERARRRMDDGREPPDESSLIAQATEIIDAITAPSLRRVINATGVLLHTNLGRAPLGARLCEEIAPIVSGYANVEFDLDTGSRGHRNDHVRELLRYLTGAEDALVVNNNAAAIILILHHLAAGKEVIVSRGELIEIGGSFRIPDIMRAGGAVMVEVGTTNKTRLSDYADAISDRTALLFKAHKSNYAIHGFTEEPAAEELARLAHEHDLPLVHDLGSGLLRRPRMAAMRDEPDVREALAAGADLVSFSGDKLVGGPQAGIVVGRQALVARLARDPLMRALRVGKLTLAALAAACRHYLSDQALFSGNPTFGMLRQTPAQLTSRAEKLAGLLHARGIESRVIESSGKTGGGALPDMSIPSRALALALPKARAEAAQRALMRAATPVVGIMREGELVLDMLTVADNELDTVAASVTEALEQRA